MQNLVELGVENMEDLFDDSLVSEQSLTLVGLPKAKARILLRQRKDLAERNPKTARRISVANTLNPGAPVGPTRTSCWPYPISPPSSRPAACPLPSQCPPTPCALRCRAVNRSPQVLAATAGGEAPPEEHLIRVGNHPAPPSPSAGSCPPLPPSCANYPMLRSGSRRERLPAPCSRSLS